MLTSKSSISSSLNSFNLTSSLLSFNTLTSKHKACNSLIRTLNDSGTPGSGMFSPLTIASYVLTLPTTSSDLTVNISCSV